MTVEQEEARYAALVEERRGYELRKQQAATDYAAAGSNVLAKANAVDAGEKMAARIALVDQELAKLETASKKAGPPKKPGTKAPAAKKPGTKKSGAPAAAAKKTAGAKAPAAEKTEKAA